MKLFFAFLVLMSASVWAAENEPSLEDQMKALNIANQAPAGVQKDTLYVVQDRYLQLTHKSEASVGFAENLTGDSLLTTRQIELGYRFHFNGRWSLGSSGAFVSNQFTETAKELQASHSVAPDLTYARSRVDLTLAYNVFYGKFRLGLNQVFYFDQYVAVGPGLMFLNTEPVGSPVADVGFAFWLGQWGSARVGLKDYYYTATNNVHGHVDIGYIF